MKNLLLSILGVILLIPNISKAANDEIVWEKDYPVLVGDDFLILHGQNSFFVHSRSKVYGLNILTGELQDSINFEDYFTEINQISITNDDKYLALSGDSPYLIIWDMENKQIYKKFTKKIFEGQEADSWKSVSISPDGTKLTAIAVKEFSSIVTELDVFDIETGEVILSENRNNMDKIGQVYYGPIWVSTEFSPSGEYMVTELSVNWDHQSGQVILDSVYIYKTNDFKINDILMNNFDQRDISFSSYENVISSNYGRTSTIYNLDTKKSIKIALERQPQTVLFPRLQSSKILISLGTKVYIHDIFTKSEVYKYTKNISATLVSENDSKVIGFSENGLICLNAFWNMTPVESNTSQNILYPNPVNSVLKINFTISKSANFNYDLFDVNSNRIASKSLNFLQKGQNEVNISFNSYPPQTYYIKIYSPFETFDFKIIKE